MTTDTAARDRAYARSFARMFFDMRLQPPFSALRSVAPWWRRAAFIEAAARRVPSDSDLWGDLLKEMEKPGSLEPGIAVTQMGPVGYTRIEKVGSRWMSVEECAREEKAAWAALGLKP